MDIVNFSIWKFRYIEGILRGMNAFNVRTTKYIDPVTKEVSWIRYDYENEKATIEKTEVKRSVFFKDSEESTKTMECRFSELEQTLKDLGMYHELPEGEHHILAGHQKEDAE